MRRDSLSTKPIALAPPEARVMKKADTTVAVDVPMFASACIVEYACSKVLNYRVERATRRLGAWMVLSNIAYVINARLAGRWWVGCSFCYLLIRRPDHPGDYRRPGERIRWEDIAEKLGKHNGRKERTSTYKVHEEIYNQRVQERKNR